LIPQNYNGICIQSTLADCKDKTTASFKRKCDEMKRSQTNLTSVIAGENENVCEASHKARYHTGLFKKKYTLSKVYFTKTTDAKSTSCVRMERKSLKVLTSMI
jgi:hypothetical protein